MELLGNDRTLHRRKTFLQLNGISATMETKTNKKSLSVRWLDLVCIMLASLRA